MPNQEERRSPEARRIGVEKLVEVCSAAAQSPFEARSVDVSGRGMHLVTSYALAVGDELVCRVDHDGTPIVVEGRVAWSKPSADGGGEFGVQFTALDGGSVDALRALCSATGTLERETEAEALPLEEGTKVKLYIDGLAAPMKARVREAGMSRLRVGSNLEFLKIGRRIDIQAVAEKAGFSATVEGLEVRFDPRTQIPELVVTLRRSGTDATPDPSVVEIGTDTGAADASLKLDPQAGTPDEHCSVSAGELSELRAQIGAWAGKIGSLARASATGAFRSSKVAFLGLSRAFSKGRGKGERAGSVAPRRTAPPPGGGFATVPGIRTGGRISPSVRRQQNPTRPPPAGIVATISPKARLLGLGSMVLLVVGVVGATIVRKGGAASTSSNAATAASSPVTQPTGGPSGSATNALAQQPGGIVAEVPLFGPTPMATTEPAPAVADEAAPAMSEGERELMLARAAAAEDEAFEPAPPELKPEQVPAFQRGALHLPVVHRLKLDGPGTALAGTPTSTGFKVVLAGRKVLDNGRTIERRDSRVLRVRTNNTDQGAEVTFQFSGPVPGYKVRLRGEHVEFFLSSPKNVR